MVMARVRTVWTGVPGTPYYSNHYFDVATLPDVVLAVDSVRSMWDDQAPSMINDLSAQIESEVPVIDPATGDMTSVFNVPQVPPVVGTNTGQPLPPFTQLLMTVTTETILGGRRIRGRFFWPGWPEEVNVDPGVPGLDLRNAARNAADTLIANDPPLMVWSRKNGVAVQATGISAGEQWSVLRSRRD